MVITMIKKIECFNRSSAGHKQVEIETTTCFFIFYITKINSSLFDYEFEIHLNGKSIPYISSRRYDVQFFLDILSKEKIKSYELIFSESTDNFFNDLFFNIKKNIIKEIEQNYMKKSVSKYKKMYDEISKLEKQYKHIKKEEVFI